MAEPWDLRPNDERLADTLKTFIIFCEDEHHEPLYFKSFEQQKGGLKINAIGNQKQRKLNLNNTIIAGKEMGLIEFEAGGYKIMDGVTEQIWCVYDRDIESEDIARISQQKNIDFDTAIQTAMAAGLKVAWSNDAFELWLLLHFELVPLGNMLHRSYIYARLTEVFKTLLPRYDELDAITTIMTFNYKNNLKRRDVFINHVIPQLHSRTNLAIKNAKVLESQFTKQVPFHERNPCTMVHYLIVEILAKAI